MRNYNINIATLTRALEYRLTLDQIEQARQICAGYAAACERFGVPAACGQHTIERVYLEALQEVQRGDAESGAIYCADLYEQRDYSLRGFSQ